QLAILLPNSSRFQTESARPFLFLQYCLYSVRCKFPYTSANRFLFECNMTDLNNITVTTLEDGMVSLLVDQQPISEKYGMKFDASIVDDIQTLENGQKLKLFDQFVFSHTDLNFE